MSKIFSLLNEFPHQSKDKWIEKFLSEKTTNKIEDIQHKINNEIFDPIYFNNEIEEKNTFLKNKFGKKNNTFFAYIIYFLVRHVVYN